VTVAFYERTPDGFTPTDYVTGPWDPEMSHAGPPAALLINEIVAAVPDMGITRVTFDIPRGVPKVPYRVPVEIVRPGKKIQAVRAEIHDEAGNVLMTASAWCMRVTDVDIPVSDPITLDGTIDVPTVEESDRFEISFGGGLGYMDGVEMRAALGAPFRGGPSAIWIRQTIPLVAGETADPYTLCGMFGDLANGISALAPFTELMAINTDLTLYLSRRPHHDWIGMRSATISQGLGLGMTDSVLYDASGFVARTNQSIFFDRF
jgi:Acyl-CoA thioesterase C-terminal domain/Acyl-CoA thioesterase N-terminal domain